MKASLKLEGSLLWRDSLERKRGAGLTFEENDAAGLAGRDSRDTEDLDRIEAEDRIFFPHFVALHVSQHREMVDRFDTLLHFAGQSPGAELSSFLAYERAIVRKEIQSGLRQRKG